MSFNEYGPKNCTWRQFYARKQKIESIKANIAAAVLTIAFPFLYCVFGALE